jgi:hypothetical protein
MEIEIRARSIIAVLLPLLLGFACILGKVVTPYIEGRPRLLSRELVALISYLEDASSWLSSLEREIALLAEILPEEVDPSPRPPDLYERARRGEEALERLVEIRRRMEEKKVPKAFQGFHKDLVETCDRSIELAIKVLEQIGSPSQERKEEIASLLKRIWEELEGRKNLLLEHKSEFER